MKSTFPHYLITSRLGILPPWDVINYSHYLISFVTSAVKRFVPFSEITAHQ